MKFRTLRKKAAAGFLAAALVVGSVSAITFTGDFAQTYTNQAPTKALTADSSILSGATAAANTTVLSILGIDVTSTDAAGVYNSAGYNGRTTPVNLLMFGSSWNSNADPYLTTFYYNLAALDTGGNTYDADDYEEWTGHYTLINYAKSGPTGAANNETVIPIAVDVDLTDDDTDNDEAVECNPLFYYQPDVLLGSSTSSYDTGLAYYQSTIDSTYSPLQVGGWSTSDYCLNDGTFASTVAMCNGVWEMATEIQTYANSIGKSGRYGDIADIGEAYAAFDLGLYYYAQSLFANKSLTKVNYCTALTVNSDGTYTIGTGSGRMVQYADGLGNLVSSGSNLSLSELGETVDVVIASNLTDDQIDTLDTVGIKVLTSLPTTVYGSTMQSADNGIGLPYVFAFFYEDQMEESKSLDAITTADVVAYWDVNFYHLNTSAVSDAVALMMDGLGESTSVSSSYSSTIAAAISAGTTYYKTLDSTNSLWVDWEAVN